MCDYQRGEIVTGRCVANGIFFFYKVGIYVQLPKLGHFFLQHYDHDKNRELNLSLCISLWSQTGKNNFICWELCIVIPNNRTQYISRWQRGTKGWNINYFNNTNVESPCRTRSSLSIPGMAPSGNTTSLDNTRQCSVEYAVCSVQCEVCSVQYAVWSEQCVVCSVQCAMCSV